MGVSFLLYFAREKGEDLLGERPQNELALSDADMGHIETLMTNDLVTIEQNIEINIPRPLVDDFAPAHLIFDELQLIQKSERLELGLNLELRLVSNLKDTSKGSNLQEILPHMRH